MTDRIMTWLNGDKGDGSDKDPGFRRAVCLLLVCAARADGSFAVEEAREIARLVSGYFDLPPEETAELVTMTAAEDEQGFIAAARVLNEEFSADQRREVLELMWRVVFADGKLEVHEDALVHSVGRMLNIPPRDLVAIKLAVRDG